jgi:transcription elongation factor GreA
MEQQATYLTEEGEKKLRAELEHLTGTVREELAKRLRSAIQMGDLSENADYHAAKEEQGFVEGRIAYITQLLRNVVIIEENKPASGKVEIGSTVTIQEGNGPEMTYTIVGSQEADPMHGRMSFNSPIGQALIGHTSGETVDVATPVGSKKFTIKKIA